VILIIRVDQSNERPSIYEYHGRFRRLFKASLKLRPVSAERPGFPPLTTPIKSAIASYGAAIGSCHSTHASIACRITSEVEIRLRLAMRAMRCRIFPSSLNVKGDDTPIHLT
jgi:hypothetical protein